MADETYTLPEEPAYSIQEIRKLQNTDRASAEDVFNPLIQKILECVEYLRLHTAALDESGKVPLQYLSGGFVAQAEAPADTALLWINTSLHTLNYYNEEKAAWKAISGVWGEAD